MNFILSEGVHVLEKELCFTILRYPRFLRSKHGTEVTASVRK